MLTIAIGRNGQNVRLASQLTGWNIDVRSEMQKKEENAKHTELAHKELGRIEGVGTKLAEVLIKGGWNSAEKIASASVEQLTSLQGIGGKTAEKLIESAKAVLEKAENIEEAKTSGQESEDFQGEGQGEEQNTASSAEENNQERFSETEKDSSRQSQ
jgi:N utilization substance protein A